MSRFYFIHEDAQPYTRVSIETDVYSLDDVLREMECFLRGVGYHLEGRLDIVPWDNINQHTNLSTPADEIDSLEGRN